MLTDSISTNKLFTIPEVAEMLKVSVMTMRRLQKRRLIPFYKISGGIRFTMEDVKSYLQSSRVEVISVNKYDSTKNSKNLVG